MVSRFDKLSIGEGGGELGKEAQVKGTDNPCWINGSSKLKKTTVERKEWAGMLLVVIHLGLT